jgi:hypothetical protein
MTVEIKPPDPAASRWKTTLRTFLGSIFQHPGSPPFFPPSRPATGSFNGLFSKGKFVEP